LAQRSLFLGGNEDGKKVGIVGAAVTPFKGKWYQKTYYELAQMATRDALADAGLTSKDVDAVFLCHLQRYI